MKFLQNVRSVPANIYRSTLLVEYFDGRKPPVAPTFKDVPFLITSIYLVVVVFIGGLIATINHDSAQKKAIEEAHAGAFTNKHALYTTNALASSKNDMILALTDSGSNDKVVTKVSGVRLFQLYYQMLHPLSGLYYSFDPSLPSIFTFLTLFLRILIIYSLSFAMFKDKDSSLFIEDDQ